METQEIIKFLQQDNLRVVTSYHKTFYVKHTGTFDAIYFNTLGTQYKSYSVSINHPNYQSLERQIQSIIRIEKKLDEEYYPIWTKNDGFITESDKFVKLKGKYYTHRFLEKLIDILVDFKEITL